ELADHWKICRRDGFPGIVSVAEIPPEFIFHVGLAGTEPDLANEYVFNGNLLVACDDAKFGGVGTGREWIERDSPFPVFGSFGDLLLSGKRYFDRLSRNGPSPDFQGEAPLEHHVIRKDTGQVQGVS